MKKQQMLFLVVILLFGCSVQQQEAIAHVTLTEAIAGALQDAQVAVAVNVPATGVTEVFDKFCELTGRPKTYSYHEEVAYTIAHGAGIGGVRSVAILKSHGFAKAANSVIDSITAGTNAGFVALVFDDKTGIHSDNVFDTLPFIRRTKILHVIPAPDDI